MPTNNKKTKYGVIITYNQSENLMAQNKIQKTKLAKIKLAGQIAENLILGSSIDPQLDKDGNKCFHANDKAKALKIAQGIVFDGLEESQLPKEEKNELIKKAYDLLKTWQIEVTKLLTKNINNLKKISTQLAKSKTLTCNELKGLMQK